jgi:hypothetical protein
MRRDVPPVGAPYRMARGEWRVMHYPPRLNYSMEALKAVSEERHDMLKLILEEIAQNEFGVTGDSLAAHIKYSDYILRTGLIKPMFVDNEEGTVVYFDMWSYFRNEYVSFVELEPFEQQYSDFFFQRMFHVN